MMARIAPVVPAESDILCEFCGYTLNGLPESGNCPECGQAIVRSISEDERRLTDWDLRAGNRLSAFLKISLLVLFRPSRFFRSLTTRTSVESARRFAIVHWCIASIFFGVAAFVHVVWYRHLTGRGGFNVPLGIAILASLSLITATFLVLSYVTRVAAKLTNWEATYRGLRMPEAAVLRGMYYHAAHYTPVALIAFCTVYGYSCLLINRMVSIMSASAYLYVLCGEVIIGAAYLFNTYWIAMRNMMYANR